MNPADLLLIIQGIEAAIAAAPKLIAVAQKGKELITTLFEGGAMTVEQQNSTHAHIDAVQAAVLAGNVPPAWTVEADPTSPEDVAAIASAQSAGQAASESAPVAEVSAPAPTTDGQEGNASAAQGDKTE